MGEDNMSWIQDIVNPKKRKWEEFYRNRFQHDKIVRSTPRGELYR